MLRGLFEYDDGVGDLAGFEVDLGEAAKGADIFGGTADGFLLRGEGVFGVVLEFVNGTEQGPDEAGGIGAGGGGIEGEAGLVEALEFDQFSGDVESEGFVGGVVLKGGEVVGEGGFGCVVEFLDEAGGEASVGASGTFLVFVQFQLFEGDGLAWAEDLGLVLGGA